MHVYLGTFVNKLTSEERLERFDKNAFLPFFSVTDHKNSENGKKTSVLDMKFSLFVPSKMK